jgi:exo-beta-1,3-glucanase (GH17 family)
MKIISIIGWAAAALIATATAVTARNGGPADSLQTTAENEKTGYSCEQPFVTRSFRLSNDERWIGNAIAYGPYRDGQSPGGSVPSREELREDLRLMSKHWSLIRLYGATDPTEAILDVIREDNLDMKVMLGVWIDPEERSDEDGQVIEQLENGRAANRREIEAAVRLTATYPKIVLAVCVGNETQVFWSSHRVPPGLLIEYVREVRARTAVPVATADDFNFWNKPESHAVAREVDIVITHMHPLWNGLQIASALEWTQNVFSEIKAEHPDRLVVLGETGWATQKHNVGEQAELMKGRAGEAEQKLFYDAVTAWAEEDRIPLFFFVAFDENWKGGEHPNEVEKHWGLYRADRTAKKAMDVEE